jgi:AcrR family transcriptional regulator
MPAAVLPKEELIVRILQVFRDYGYEGASLARLSKATGLGRSSLYHYFPNGKEDMAEAAVAAVGAWFGANVAPVLSGPGDARQRLENYAAKMIEFYNGGENACLANLFSLGDAAGIFQPSLGQRMKRLIDAIAAVLESDGIASEEALRRAENAVIALQGSLVVARALQNKEPFLRTMSELPDTLLPR